MRLGKAVASLPFAFWTLAALVTLALAALHPLDGQWWLMFAICLVGVALYFPVPGTARLRKKITVERPQSAVYDFLNQPDNLHRWNPRVGAAQPANIPVEVGQEWTYSPGRWWFVPVPSPLRHAFSKVDPSHMIEITATGRRIRVIYAYTLRDLGQRTEVILDVALTGMPAALGWLTSAITKVYPSRDLARLKRALELGSSTRDPSASH